MSRRHRSGKSKIGLLIISVGVICVLVSLGMLIYVEITDKQANEFCQEVLVDLDAAIEENMENIAQMEGTDEMDDFDLSYELLKALNVDGLYYMGVLIIPELSLELPVQATWSYAQLKDTPCLYSGNLAEDNAIIMAHNYDSHFGDLAELEIGDTVKVVAVAGVVLEYKVISMELVSGTDAEYVQEGDWDLTLFTCNVLNNSQRVVVRCERI